MHDAPRTEPIRTRADMRSFCPHIYDSLRPACQAVLTQLEEILDRSEDDATGHESVGDLVHDVTPWRFVSPNCLIGGFRESCREKKW